MSAMFRGTLLDALLSSPLSAPFPTLATSPMTTLPLLYPLASSPLRKEGCSVAAWPNSLREEGANPFSVSGSQAHSSVGEKFHVGHRFVLKHWVTSARS